MVEAAQVAGEVVSRSRVGLCDRAARQWKVRPGMRLHVPTVPLCASPEAAVRPHNYVPASQLAEYTPSSSHVGVNFALCALGVLLRRGGASPVRRTT